MTPKTFRDNLKMGNVLEIEIIENLFNRSAVVYFKLRRQSFDHELSRFFPSRISAVKFVLNCIDKPIIDGLSDEYRAIPPVRIITSQRRLKNETSKHEQKAKSPEFQQGSEGQPAE